MKDLVTATEEGADPVHLPRPALPLRAEFRQAPVVVLDGGDGLVQRDVEIVVEMLSARSEQDLQPSSQSGSNMKW